MGPVLDKFNPQLSATKKAKQKYVSKAYSLQGFNGCHYVVFIELIHFFGEGSGGRLVISHTCIIKKRSYE